MTYTLRPYQSEAVRAAVWGLTQYAKPFIVVAATGAGKSLIIAQTCRDIDEPVLILQPSKEILEQNYEKLLSYDPDIDVSMYSASVGEKVISKYTFATVGSIYKHPELFAQFKFIIIDECHQVDVTNPKGMYQTFLRQLGVTRVMGLTATPYRIVNKFFTDEYGQQWYRGSLRTLTRMFTKTSGTFWKKIVFKIETKELIEQGYLSPIDYYTSYSDISELVPNKAQTDFTPESLELWGGKRVEQIGKAIIFADSQHKRSLTFCSSITQAWAAFECVPWPAIKAAVVTGETPKKERERIIAAYRTGEIRHLLNVGVFTTGFDMPVLDCVILARPTMSLALYYQMVGRGVRLDPEDATKRLSVYDLAGVSDSMGKVEDIRVTAEKGGFRDEVHGGNGRLDETELFSFYIKTQKYRGIRD